MHTERILQYCLSTVNGRTRLDSLHFCKLSCFSSAQKGKSLLPNHSGPIIILIVIHGGKTVMKHVIRYVKPHLPTMAYGFTIKFTGTIMELLIPDLLPIQKVFLHFGELLILLIILPLKLVQQIIHLEIQQFIQLILLVLAIVLINRLQILVIDLDFLEHSFLVDTMLTLIIILTIALVLQDMKQIILRIINLIKNQV